MNSTDNLVNGTVVMVKPIVVLEPNNNAYSAENGSVKSKVDSDYPEDDFDPLREEVPENERTNYIQTLMNLMNGIIGSGVLSMPIAFLNGGWLVACIVTPLIGLISTYCIHLLLSVNVYLTKVTGKTSPYDYHEVISGQQFKF